VGEELEEEGAAARGAGCRYWIVVVAGGCSAAARGRMEKRPGDSCLACVRAVGSVRGKICVLFQGGRRLLLAKQKTATGRG